MGGRLGYLEPENRCRYQKMRMLELLAGTGSMGHVFEAQGWEVTSVDLEGKFKPSLQTNVLDLALDRWPEGDFQYIHASPPCTSFSKARSNGKDTKEGLERSDRLVLDTNGPHSCAEA